MFILNKNYNLALIDIIRCGWSKEWLLCFGVWGRGCVYTVYRHVVLKKAQEAKPVYIADRCYKQLGFEQKHTIQYTEKLYLSFCYFITSVKAVGSLVLLVRS